MIQDNELEAKNELFDAFGKFLMERIRDKNIASWDSMVEAPKGEYWGQFEPLATSLTAEQKDFLRKLAIEHFDSMIHDLLFMFETQEWITIRLQNEAATIEDIRRATKGDLQGYTFIWAEQFSHYPISS